MKLIHKILILVLLVNLSSYSQKIIIPYRVGDKFGLSDKDGKLMVDPIYDEMELLTANYFKYALKNNKSTPHYGVFKNDKLIIKEQTYPNYFVYKDEFIVGSKNPMRPEYCNIFNMRGEQVFKHEVKSIYVNDHRDLANFYRDKGFTFISYFESSVNKKYNIILFDKKTQQLGQEILKDIKNYRIDKTKSDHTHLYCTYFDAKGVHQNSIITYDENTKKFVVNDIKTIQKKEMNEYGSPNAGAYDVVYDDDYNIEEEEEEEVEEQVTSRNRKKSAYYKIKIKDNDTTLFFDDKQIKLKNMYLFSLRRNRYSIPATQYQLHPVIYKKKKKFGIISNTNKIKAKYDSILYIRDGARNLPNRKFYYLVGKKKKGTWKFGIIDQNNNITIPLIYNEINTNIPLIGYGYKEGRIFKINNFSSLEKQKNEIRYNTKNCLYVKKDGKYGIINTKNETIIPIEYDGIYENDFWVRSQIRNKDKDYLIFEKESKFGFEKRKIVYKTPNFKPQLLFPELPVAIYTDYRNEKGFTLVQLESPKEFFCFANADGTIYYREK